MLNHLASVSCVKQIKVFKVADVLLMDTSHVNIIINLKVIACLQPYQRLNTRETLFHLNNYKYIPEWVQRWFEGSSRDSDFSRINDLYIAAVECKVDLFHLTRSIRGLQSLKKTYAGDTTMVARIDTLIEHITSTVETSDGKEV